MPDDTGPGSLTLVLAPATRLDAVEAALRRHVPGHNVRRLGDALLAFTDAPVDTVRDWLRDAVAPDDPLFVAQFEHWSGAGPIDVAWLRRRGH